MRFGSLAAMAAAVLLLAGTGEALAAGSYTWKQPASFTATAPGANPDHDAYGATPWSYLGGSARLGSFATGIAGGLAGWESGNAFIAVDPTASPISNGGDGFSPGQLVMRPDATAPVTLAWTSPFAQPSAVSISGSVASADSSLCLLSGYAWTLSAGSTVLQSGGGGATISSGTTLPAGGNILLTVAYNGGLGGYDAACDTAEVTLNIAASGSAPAVSITGPANGSIITAGQPTLAGAADVGFGSARQVQVRLYSGSTTSGSPVQTLSAPVAANGAWSVASSGLPNGVYTAQASEADLATPADVGTSNTTSFELDLPGGGGGGGGGGAGSGATLQLTSPAGAVLTTPTPTLTGVAPASAAGATVGLSVYSGSGASAKAVRVMTTTIDGQGNFSFTVTPALADGAYSAVAETVAGGVTLFSAPLSLSIEAHPPALSMTIPGSGAAAARRPAFFGAAGTIPGDSSTVTVRLYSGPAASGTPVGTETTTRNGGYWLAVWPHDLHLGIYTVQASQSDLAGTATVAHTFIVVPSPRVLGAVDVAQDGLASVPVVCPGGPNTRCTGRLSVTSARRIRFHGARRRVTLFRARFSMPGTSAAVVRGHLSGALERSLRRAGHLQVALSASIRVGSGRTRTYKATRRATFAR